MKNVSRQREHQTSPERNRVWTEPESIVTRMKRVSVIYYLSRNGHLQHPHFMEVTLSCPDGLYLKDVIRRLNLLRGYGIASSYSWSSKRSYKNGFVWHDLCEDDYIHPVHGLEYVLKGSEILLKRCESEEEDSDSSLNMSSAKNQHWKTKSDVSTQIEENEVEGSPPVVESSPETLESLMKADKRVMVEQLETTNTNINMNTKTKSNEEDMESGSLKASSVLMQLITCGSFSFRHTHNVAAAEHHGVKLITNQHKDEDKDDELTSLKRTSSYNAADRVRQSEMAVAGTAGDGGLIDERKMHTENDKSVAQ